MKFSLALISLLLTPVAITARVGVPQELDGRRLPADPDVTYGTTGAVPNPATIEWKTYTPIQDTRTALGGCKNDNPIDRYSDRNIS